MELIAYTLPALIVLIASVGLTWLFFRNEDRKRKLETYSKNMEIILPLRLQAYERIILLLERISPSNLIVRVQQPGMSVVQLQTELLMTIRHEFEHNLSQQMYISSELWRKVAESKDHLVKLINTSVIEIRPTAPALELIKAILERQIDKDVTSTQYAIELVKKELRQLF
jgi:hypothetical protein